MTTTRPGYIWSGTEWVAIGQEAVLAPISYQTSAPSSPATGDVWIDSNDDVPSVNSTLYYRWKKTATGGETSFTGTDDNSLTLAYTAGYESVFINGVLQVRGSDYTATTGTSITGLTALTAGDIVMVESVMAYSVGDTYTQSQMTSLLGGKSDVSTTGMVLLNTTSFTAQSSIAINNIFDATYKYYKVLVNLTVQTADGELGLKLRSGTTDASTSYYNGYSLSNVAGTASTFYSNNSTTYRLFTFDTGLNKAYPSHDLTIFNPFETVYTTFTGNLTMTDTAGSTILNGGGGGTHEQSISYNGFNLIASAGSVTGLVKVYGYK